MSRQHTSPAIVDERAPQAGTAEVGPRLLTVRAAAEYLGLTPRQVRGLIWRGMLPVVRLRRLIYLDRRDLEAFPDRHKRNSQSCARV